MNRLIQMWHRAAGDPKLSHLTCIVTLFAVGTAFVGLTLGLGWLHHHHFI